MEDRFEVQSKESDGIKCGLGLNFDELVEMVGNGDFSENLPPEAWALRGRDPYLMDSFDVEVTLAHIAVMHGRLPSNFSLWGLVDDDGWTVLTFP